MFVGLRPLEGGYLLAELAGQQQAAAHRASALTAGAAFLRLGWFWSDAVDLFAELGYRRIVDHPELSRERATAGSNWQLCSWLELIPSVQFEHASGEGSELVLLGQLHLMH